MYDRYLRWRYRVSSEWRSVIKGRVSGIRLIP